MRFKFQISKKYKTIFTSLNSLMSESNIAFKGTYHTDNKKQDTKSYKDLVLLMTKYALCFRVIFIYL